ncbi:MAG: prenyltransferase/squalene oxidase repeat-containing protein [Gemmataceae bacterium]
MRSACLALLLPLAARAAAPPDPVDSAVRRALRRLEQGASSYVTHRQCFSCHHQSLTIAALSAAKRRGFAVGQRLLDEQTSFTLDTFRPNLARVRKGENVGGRNTTVAYALFTLQAAGHPADETTGALIDFLLARQEKDGSWPAVTQRNPSEGSRFTNAALALDALRRYGPGDGTKDARITVAVQRGVDWLMRSQPLDNEDRAFRLRALSVVSASRGLIEEARHDLVGRQLPDGSWRQTASRDGDAYATATVLVALRHAGSAPEEVPYRKGIAYLLRTQRPDGAWIVTTRSKPIQRWFDNGDPGGKSQFISFLATGWATLALLESRPLP